MVLNPSYFGTMGHHNTMIHEMGHILGLYHVFKGVSERDSCDDPCQVRHLLIIPEVSIRTALLYLKFLTNVYCSVSQMLLNAGMCTFSSAISKVNTILPG